ncbi:MAG: amidohydrolase family protein, partial [Zavarzinia sp.]|nr:amidohydrolase family protein [Zavarzinia sp.]
LPLAAMAMELPPEDLEAIVELGLLEVAASGATTVVESFRQSQAMTFDVAARLGLRFYGAPYLFSAASYAAGDTGTGGTLRDDARHLVAETLRFHRDYDGGADGRLKFVLGPHAVDTCDAALLAAVRDAAAETGCLVTLHAAQSAGERQIMMDRHGEGALDHLTRAGLLGPGTILAHCIHLDDTEIGRMADSGAAVASCPTVFARGGDFAPYWRFKRRGVRVGLGTDAYRMDFITEMRNAGLVSKLEEHAGGIASAHDLLATATVDAAAILGRSDLGILRAGAQADIVIVDLSRASLQPIFDPVKSLVWYASAQDIDTVLVAGNFVMRDRMPATGDPARVAAKAGRAVRKVWDNARARGLIS